jgi:hypothetical protein
MNTHQRLTLIICTATMVATPLFAKMGDGIRLGNSTSLSTVAGTRAGYDSNAGRAEFDEIDENFYEVILGLGLQSAADWGSLDLRLAYADRTYEGFEARSDDSVRDSFQLIFGDANGWQLELVQAYVAASDYMMDASSIGLRPPAGGVSRNSIVEGNAASLDRTTEVYGAKVRNFHNKTTFGLGAGYEKVTYEEVNASDWDQVAILGNADHPIGPKTDAILELEVAQQEADSLSSELMGASARLGVHYRATAKSDVRASGGYRQNRYDADGSDLHKGGFDYSILGMWNVTTRARIGLSAKSDFLPSDLYIENAKRLDHGSISANIAFSPRWSTALTGIYRKDDYLLPIGDVENPSQNTAMGIASLMYHARRDLFGASLSARYESFDSNFNNDYDAVIVALGASVRY